MNRNNFWKLVPVVLVLVWSVYEVDPPTARDLVQVFQDRASSRDTNFLALVSRARELKAKAPQRGAYENLREAIGTNDIARYLPFYNPKEQQRPTLYILNRLQRAAAGRVRLGLDLQGGTSFLVKMDTSSLTNSTDAPTFALSQAVEVLRKTRGPVWRGRACHPARRVRIPSWCSYPGLSAADQETAKNTISKAAFLEFRMVHPQSDELIQQGLSEPGYELLRHKEKDARRQGADGLKRW